MILSFSVFKDKIEKDEKCQTIRAYSPGQYRRFLNCWEKRESTGRYNLFWHNPRNGGTRIRDAVPGDKPFLISFAGGGCPPFIRRVGRPDEIIDLQDLAKRDGFESSSDMWRWFETAYGFGMYQRKFMVIRWNPKNGP